MKRKVTTLCIDVLIPEDRDMDEFEFDVWQSLDYGNLKRVLDEDFDCEALGCYCRNDGISYYKQVYNDLVEESRSVKKEALATNGWWNKYYNEVSPEEVLDYEGGDNVEDASVEGVDDLDFTHVAWLMGKDDYMIDLEDEGYGLLELAKDDTGKIGLYFLMNGRVFEIDEDEIDKLVGTDKDWI